MPGTQSSTQPTFERAEPFNNLRQVGLADPFWSLETEAGSGEASGQGPTGKKQRRDLNPRLTGPEH